MGYYEGRQNNAFLFQNVHVPIPGNMNMLGYMVKWGGREADGIQAANQTTLKGGDYSRLLKWAQRSHKGPCKRKREAEEQES